MPSKSFLLLLIFLIVGISVQAQSSLKKAEAYAELNAHFLSIKYFQKHLKESTTDRKAMAQLAKSYFKANMPKESLKWFLKAYDSKNLPLYVRQIVRNNSKTKALKKRGALLLKSKVKNLYSRKDIQFLTQTSPKQKQEIAVKAASAICLVF